MMDKLPNESIYLYTLKKNLVATLGERKASGFMYNHCRVCSRQIKECPIFAIMNDKEVDKCEHFKEATE